MARKRHRDEDAMRLLREIEVHLASGNDVTEACRKAGISDATYYNWRRKFGGVSRSQLAEKKALEKENEPVVTPMVRVTLAKAPEEDRRRGRVGL